LKARKPSSVKGSGERSSQAQNAALGRPAASSAAAMRAKPSASGTGSAKRARSMRKPGSAATPAEYWNTPGTNRNPPAATVIVEDMPARLPGTPRQGPTVGARVKPGARLPQRSGSTARTGSRFPAVGQSR
jgi:hypothetical protein